MLVLGILILLILFMIIGMPVMAAIGLISVSMLATQVGQLVVVAFRMFTALDNFIFLSIPLFIFAAELMIQSGLMDALVKFCMAMLGHIKGGLALVNVMNSMIFAGVTGSASAHTAGLGRMEIAVMTKAGYDRTYATSVSVASSILGPILPPSNIMIIYAGATGAVSITGLFLAGVLPGILLGFILLGLCFYIAVRNNHPVNAKATWRQRYRAMIEVLPVLMMPGIILGGILSGIFTATESAAVAVAYALIIAIVKRKLNIKLLYSCCLRAAKTSCSIMLIISVASIMGYGMTLLRLPQLTTEWAIAHIHNPIVFLLFVNVLLLLIGLVMDQAPALLLMTPILLPIANQFEINPIHFGLIVVFNLTISLITPPVGMQLFIGANVGEVKLTSLYRAILPFAAVSIIALFVITYIPWFATFLPRLAGFIN